MKFKILLAVLIVVPLFLVAQKKSPSPPQPKQPLSAAVYDAWREIGSKNISRDGAYAAISVNPQDGDGKVVFFHLKTNQQDSIRRAENITLTYDSKFAIFKIKPQQKILKDLRRLKKKKEELPKDSLGLYSFATRKTQKIPQVKAYKIPDKKGGWVAYQLEAREEKPKTGEKSTPDPSKKAKKIKKNTDDNGYTLVLRNLSDQQETTFGYVKEFIFAKFGQGMLFTTTGNDSTMKAGMYWFDLESRKVQALHEGKPKFKYKGLSISEDGTRTAFLLDADTTKAPLRHFQLFHWRNGDSGARQLDVQQSLALPPSWLVSEHYTPKFSKDGSKLFFGSAPAPALQDTTLLTEEIVSVEIWGGKDDFIYPQQNKQADAELKRSHLAMIDLEAKKIFQIGRENITSMDPGDEGNAPVVLGQSNKAYRKMIVWDPNTYNDFFLFDLKGQVLKSVAEKVKGNASLSPKANYVYWFSLTDTAWFSYSVDTEKVVNLTASIPTKFADEEDDHPDYPSEYGIGGWTANDESILIYDRYDIWAADPQNKKPAVNLTQIGRKEKTVFRYLNTDPDQRFIDPSKDIILSAFNEITKASGFYKLSVRTGKLTKLVLDNFRYGGLVKAQDGNQLIYTRETFREFPDVWTATTDFVNPRKLTDANPQMKNYFWGNVEIVSWTSLDNVPLQGLLYKPEGFDPKKKYPMIVYFYEKESDNLYQHFPPTPLRSTIHRSTYTSDGYLIFCADIVYKIGFPGESAYNSVLPGVTSLIAKGFVDEKNIGIQGHSWGGYQAAYIVTRTNLFKACEAGAVVANMVSAYGGIRWESGLSRMFQYEHNQSRIGGTLWEKPLLYLENSPIFFADKIQTPILLMHNDADGAVPWYQGIEMFMALRRLDKPVWMLNYNGEPHWPVKRENRMDFQIRMKQFFDYYLKGAEMPRWMKYGVPAIEKGITKGY